MEFALLYMLLGAMDKKSHLAGVFLLRFPQEESVARALF